GVDERVVGLCEGAHRVEPGARGFGADAPFQELGEKEGAERRKRSAGGGDAKGGALESRIIARQIRSDCGGHARVAIRRIGREDELGLAPRKSDASERRRAKSEQAARHASRERQAASAIEVPALEGSIDVRRRDRAVARQRLGRARRAKEVERLRGGLTSGVVAGAG